MLVGLMLAIMVILTLFSIVSGGNFASGILDTTTGGTSIINGTSTTIELGAGDVLFSIDLVLGAIPILAIMIGVVVILGITALATGLSPQTVKIATYLTFYIGIWFLLSQYAEPLIRSIDIFGGIIYVGLTIGYTIGIMQNLSGGGDE